MVMSQLLTKMFIFIVLMVIGYVFARKGAVGKEFSRGLSSLVINLFMSASIINPVLNAELHLNGAELLNTMLILSLTMVISYVLATLAAKLAPVPKDNKAQFLLLIAVMNNMFVALPVVEQIYGPQAVFYCSLSCIPFNILLYTYGIWHLKGSGKGGMRIKDIISIPLIATFTALLLFVTKLPVPDALRQLCATIAGGTMPLSMLVIGVSLSSVSLMDAFRNKLIYLSSFFKLVAAPALTWLICRFFTSDPMLLNVAVIISACPTGIITTALSIQYGKDPVFTSEGILQSTALSMATIPVVAWLIV